MWDDYMSLVDDPSTPLKAIRLHCLECVGSHPSFTDVDGEEVPAKKEFAAVRDCPCTRCKLWHYRFGKNPRRKPASKKQREHARTLSKRRSSGT